MIRRVVHFSGRVQGVGFRYTTCQIAMGYAVSGTVENLRDGRVRMVVEGERTEVDGFVEELRQRMADYVDDVSERDEPATGQFAGFEIRR